MTGGQVRALWQFPSKHCGVIGAAGDRRIHKLNSMQVKHMSKLCHGFPHDGILDLHLLCQYSAQLPFEAKQSHLEQFFLIMVMMTEVAQCPIRASCR